MEITEQNKSEEAEGMARSHQGWVSGKNNLCNHGGGGVEAWGGLEREVCWGFALEELDFTLVVGGGELGMCRRDMRVGGWRACGGGWDCAWAHGVETRLVLNVWLDEANPRNWRSWWFEGRGQIAKMTHPLYLWRSFREEKQKYRYSAARLVELAGLSNSSVRCPFESQAKESFPQQKRLSDGAMGDGNAKHWGPWCPSDECLASRPLKKGGYAPVFVQWPNDETTHSAPKAQHCSYLPVVQVRQGVEHTSGAVLPPAIAGYALQHSPPPQMNMKPNIYMELPPPPHPSTPPPPKKTSKLSWE